MMYSERTSSSFPVGAVAYTVLVCVLREDDWLVCDELDFDAGADWAHPAVESSAAKAITRALMFSTKMRVVARTVQKCDEIVSLYRRDAETQRRRGCVEDASMHRRRDSRTANRTKPASQRARSC